MNQENYKILQVGESATDDEIKESYRALKKRYNEERWMDGEVGNNAARMLERLDAAYEEIMKERREQRKNTEGKNAYEEVGDLIRSGDLAGAQRKLDAFDERGAEWHYLQSVVFYRKNWINESKKQLEIAMQMDGTNTKYREAYDRLIARAEYTQKSGGAPHIDANPSSGDDQMGGSMCAQCAGFCYTYLCVNCLFNLCCGCR